MKTILMEECTAQFHGTFSNSKLGGKDVKMMGVSYVPGRDPIRLSNGDMVTDCLGTCENCDECVNGCYAIKSFKRFPTVAKNRIENTLQLRNDRIKHFSDMENAIISNNIEIVRYTESGEIEDFYQFKALYTMAVKMPNVRFYLYTKNYDVLRTFFRRYVLPQNMVVLVSVWGKQGRDEWEEFKYYNNVKCFAVNSDMSVSCYCPAYRVDGSGKVKRDESMTCAKCKLCFDSKAKVIGCYEH